MPNCTIDTISYKWIISNFSQVKDKKLESVNSPSFCGLLNSFKFCLKLYPNIFGNTSISLHFEQSSQIEEGTVNYILSFINDKQEEYNKHIGKKYFSGSPVQLKYTYKELNGNMVIETNKLFSENSGLMMNDELTVFCQINIELESSSENAFNDIISDKELIGDLAALFYSCIYSDVKILVNEHEFHAHKNILAARSTVFASMFEHDMEEKRTSTVEITDIDEDVFREFLRYIYTGQIEGIDKYAIFLISAADKYGLLTLKDVCMESLCCNINISTVIDIVIVAHLHNCDKLKKLAIEFICKHILSLSNLDNWKEKMEKYPCLMTEILRKIYICSIPSITSDVDVNCTSDVIN